MGLLIIVGISIYFYFNIRKAFKQRKLVWGSSIRGDLILIKCHQSSSYHSGEVDLPEGRMLDHLCQWGSPWRVYVEHAFHQINQGWVQFCLGSQFVPGFSFLHLYVLEDLCVYAIKICSLEVTKTGYLAEHALVAFIG
jgi:hypothetical protein